MVAVALRRDLQGQALPLDAVVTPDLAVFLDAEPVLERSADVRNESRSQLGGATATGVVLRHEPRFEVAAGGFEPISARRRRTTDASPTVPPPARCQNAANR